MKDIYKAIKELENKETDDNIYEGVDFDEDGMREHFRHKKIKTTGFNEIKKRKIKHNFHNILR